MIVGSIYAGWAPPTEAAAIGVAMAFVIAATQRAINWDMLVLSMKGTIRTSSMILNSPSPFWAVHETNFARAAEIAAASAERYVSKT
ncbi:hypothetical protein GCM10011498_14570 [Amylibacter cionae]|uniref:Uncharacterized protein n=1 Tax=Neptunicoccus cionae TaxID=2035344 RepID=A0A916QUY6_9RHOB|nr:hypothetical protein GCM10011498_14570 [Amylibacter cionae]